MKPESKNQRPSPDRPREGEPQDEKALETHRTGIGSTVGQDRAPASEGSRPMHDRKRDRSSEESIVHDSTGAWKERP